jgi:putative peptidoglycan lipid II flippase
MMKKWTHLTRISLLLAGFFALDKVLAVLRQVIIAREFGFSPVLDAFNSANNLPDLLYMLISGGALAMAFIPVLSEFMVKKGRPAAWDLFSRIANLAFLVTAVLSIVMALLAEPLVSWRLGVAPGFTPEMRSLVAELMQLNLIATLIFSLSGLVMAGLQANQQFLLPALAPILYNVGQIFGALVLSPEKGVTIGGVTLPAFGMGVHGLVYGVILGAALHFLIQVPGLIKYKFHWTPAIGLRDPGVRQVLRLLGPRVITMLFIQLIFIARDNLASHVVGAVSALTYGWMILQVPETLIGTAIGTALLPTLGEQLAQGDRQEFHHTIERALRVLVGITLPVSIVIGTGIGPLLQVAFGLDAATTALVTWVTRAYLVGLVGHCVLEVLARSFYAQQDAKLPLLASGLNLLINLILAVLLYKPLGAAGLALAISLSYTVEAIFLWVILQRRMPARVEVNSSLLRGLLGGLVGGLICYAGLSFVPLSPWMASLVGMIAGGLVAVPWVWKEARILLHL